MADAESTKHEVTKLDEESLEGVSGGGQGGKRGACPGCGSTMFESLGGDRIRCNACGWKGTRQSIGL